MQATSNRGKLYSMVRSRIFLVTVNFAWLKPLLDRTTGNYLLTQVLDSCLVFGGAAENTVCSVIRWKLNTATILSARPWSNRVKVVELYHPGKLAKPAI
ncbi:hypothetical protein MCOR27_003599 [Pyricularia oryzae]|nr:hypothetical protein MCOR27_003599 [Pyricularia oryzae]KAI6330931.1 hypothetical protein MCOR28_011526 [Pyricularia oryzae]KAI6374893.1 hypothetical protein MCOR31_002486 [Pyricularia oryzae]KAI6459123.1 hypothetical protein MCOR15_006034 [Pyricularia oryzae]